VSKKPAAAAAFLNAMKRGGTAAPVAPSEPAQTPKQTSKTREGLKHIGGYLDVDTVERVAILRARLRMDNSQLIKHAIDALFERESAARKFGDR